MVLAEKVSLGWVFRIGAGWRSSIRFNINAFDLARLRSLQRRRGPKKRGSCFGFNRLARSTRKGREEESKAGELEFALPVASF